MSAGVVSAPAAETRLHLGIQTPTLLVGDQALNASDSRSTKQAELANCYPSFF